MVPACIMAGWCSKRVCIRCCLSRRLLGFAVRGAQLHVVMPLCEQGSLARRIAERGAGLRAEEVAEVAKKVVKHEHSVWHMHNHQLLATARLELGMAMETAGTETVTTLREGVFAFGA